MTRRNTDHTGSMKTILPIMVRRVVGDSMYPTLENDQLIVLRLGAPLRIGDIVVFDYRGREKIKRIHGIEGGFLYVLGDNPRFSMDSRHFGYIPHQAVLGRVVYPRIREKS